MLVIVVVTNDKIRLDCCGRHQCSKSMIAMISNTAGHGDDDSGDIRSRLHISSQAKYLVSKSKVSESLALVLFRLQDFNAWSLAPSIRNSASNPSQ